MLRRAGEPILPLIADATTDVLCAPSPAETQAILDASPDRREFEQSLARWTGLFDRVEVAAPEAPLPEPDGPVRITFWNAERCKHLEPSAHLLGSTDAAAHLLVELDAGMARSGQVHTGRELAGRLGTGCIFAVEFLELGLGDAKEREWYAGETNRLGLHGATILSPHRLERPAVVRLESEGHWFDGQRGERRLGGRIAVLATLRIMGVPVTLASVHLESHSAPAGRAAQTEILLDAIDVYAPDQPVLIGGDFNTCTIDRDWARGTGEKPVLDPARLLDPVPYEPLFGVMEERRYDYEKCNTLGVATQRTRPDGTPPPPLGRIDWFFSRGLTASDPATIAAVDDSGSAISDHEVLAVTVVPAGRVR
jgi:endonuclease/exonuclease/phosphatase family metal-dependent hydrolase